MDEACRVRIAELILELRELQHRVVYIGGDEKGAVAKEDISFAISDLMTAVERLIKAMRARGRAPQSP